MIGLALITICSTPGVHPRTTQQIIAIESQGNALAIHVNGEGSKQYRPQRADEAARLARELISQGRSVDLGLMQVNSKNLKRLGLTPSDALDPCKNIKAGTQILKESYGRAEAALGPGQEALKAAVSAYNSGNFRTGFDNGYVGKFYGKRTRPTRPEKADIDVTFDYEGTDSGFASSRSNFEINPSTTPPRSTQ